MSRGPLSDITVVAVEQAVSAPMCTRTLADLGARVIKVENPESGDFTRAYDDVVQGLAAHFVWANRGKESLALDLKTAAGLEVMHRLLAVSDVLVSNLGPGAMGRLGLDRRALEARHPHLVTLEISGFGADGPLAHKRAYDLLIQAESGACAATGFPGQPAKPGPPVVDVCTGLYGAISILALLRERERTGTGGISTVAMFDTAVELMGYGLTHALYTQSDQQPVGMGSPALAPYGAFETADGQTVVLGTTNDAEWSRLAQMIGESHLGTDARYMHNADRVRARAELDRVLSKWCRTKTLHEIQDAADTARIGNARLNTPLEVVTHPELVQRTRWQDIESPGGRIRSLLPPLTMEGFAPAMGSVPGLGEHTDHILAELGYSVAEVAFLRQNTTT